jgi:ABC-type spermidine/putrescine transport system permease subunit II
MSSAETPPESGDRSRATAPATSTGRSRRTGVRAIALVLIIVGVVFAVAGVVAYVAVQQTLSDQKIVVADDADMFAGKKVNGPFTAYAQAMVIGEHAKDIGGGKTYAELPQDDPNRDTVMTASFLQASLFTSVVAFGVSAMATVIGIVLVLLGVALRRLDPRVA